MKFSYKFANLLGTVYRQGDIIFSKDGNSVLCPVGNKISLYDLRNSRSSTLPIEARFNYRCLALSPSGNILIAETEENTLEVISMAYYKVIYKKHIGKPSSCISVSPNGNYFAVCCDNQVRVYNMPNTKRAVFNPFIVEKTYSGAFDDTSVVQWSSDSRFIVFGSKDMSTYIRAVAPVHRAPEGTLGGHRHTIVGAFFKLESLDVITVCKDRVVISWKCSHKLKDFDLKDISEERKGDVKSEEVRTEESDDDVGTQMDCDEGKEAVKLPKNKLKEAKNQELPFKYEKVLRLDFSQYLKNMPDLTAAAYHPKLGMVMVGTSSGDFLLVEMTEGDLLHSLNVSTQPISSVAINPSGDWVALGISSLGELLVWEWQSETYVLKQQSHFNNAIVVAYSPDSQYLASGGIDGKVKVWSALSSFCFVTFDEHAAQVTGVTFTQSGKAVLSSSLDGTVRAFDLIRYRNFKTLTSPRPAQFSCLDVDVSGELVAAGGQDTHEIFLWSLKLGRLLEVLTGHEGPVVSLAFSPELGSSRLVSTGWDKNVAIWDAIMSSSAKETIEIQAHGTCVAVRPDGKEIAVASMDGHISFFEPETAMQKGDINARNDLVVGKSETDLVSAKKNKESRFFTTLCYSASGEYILAGGQSKCIYIYNVADGLLVKKFEVTQNRSFDAMDVILDRRKMAKNGVNLALVEERGEFQKNVPIPLPGVAKGDKSLRAFKPEIRVTQLAFSPTGRNFAACTTEGLLVYSLDNNWLFDPISLDVENTPSNVHQELVNQNYLKALMMAIKLNMKPVLQEVIETIPLESVATVLRDLPPSYADSVLKTLAELLEKSRHLGLLVHWSNVVLTTHGLALKSHSSSVMPALIAIQKSLTTHYTNMTKVCAHNTYMMKFLLSQSALHKKQDVKKEEVEMHVDDDDAVVSQSETAEGSTMDIVELFDDAT